MSEIIREIQQPGEHPFTFGPFKTPIAEVEPGETVRIHTLDAFGNKITQPGDKPSELCKAISRKEYPTYLNMTPLHVQNRTKIF